MDKKLFDEDTRLYKYYINNTTTDKETVEFVKNLFELELIEMDKTEGQDLLQLYDILGLDKFFEVITFFSGRSLKLPKIDKIKKSLLTAIAYYQVKVLKMSPKDAGKMLSENLGLLNLKQKNIKSLVGKLQQDINYITDSTLRQMLLNDQEIKEEVQDE